MKSKVFENLGYISLVLIFAFTLVLSFSVISINDNNVIANAQELPSENEIPTYNYSKSIVASGYDYDATELLVSDGSSIDPTAVYVPLSISQIDFEQNKDLIYQFIFYADINYEGDNFLYLTCLVSPNSFFGVAVDGGFGDYYFVFEYFFQTSDLLVVSFHQFLDDYATYGFEKIFLYDIRVINPNDTSDTLFSIVGDGMSFGFEAVSDGISYTIDNLFFDDGNLSQFSVIIFSVIGVSLSLAVIKFILRIIFRFGGVK